MTVVILWISLLIITLIVSFIDTESMRKLFTGLIITDIGLPIVAYAMMLAYKYMSGKNKKLPLSMLWHKGESFSVKGYSQSALLLAHNLKIPQIKQNLSTQFNRIYFFYRKCYFY